MLTLKRSIWRGPFGATESSFFYPYGELVMEDLFCHIMHPAGLSSFSPIVRLGSVPNCPAVDICLSGHPKAVLSSS